MLLLSLLLNLMHSCLMHKSLKKILLFESLTSSVSIYVYMHTVHIYKHMQIQYYKSEEKLFSYS